MNRFPEDLVIPLRLGIQTTYLLPAREGWVMVDSGCRGFEKVFRRRLQRWKIRPDEIKYLILTHAHHDHMGNAAFIKNMTKCRVAVHVLEAPFLRSGRTMIPPGVYWYGRLFSRLGRKWGAHHLDVPGVEPDLLLQGQSDLSRFGLQGRIVPTPGHTKGSISLVLDSGRALAGDAAVRFLPFLRPHFPPFGQDRPAMLQAWKILLETGAKTIHPGHGWPLSRDELRAEYDRLTAKWGKELLV